MVGYETEEQQWEAIKKWFNQYGNMIAWAVILISVAVMGARYWLHHQDVIKEQASEHYFSMLKSQEQNDLVSMESKANRLMQDYQKTPYAQVAAMLLAKQALEEKKYDDSISKLQWVLDQTSNNELKKIARIRLIKVYMAKGELDKAAALYNAKEANGWLTLMEELKGDIHNQENKTQDAIEAYKAAVKAAPDDTLHGPLLTLKLNDLGLSNDAIDELKAQNNG